MAIKTRLISFVWGFAEATFFFLVPDIWLSRIVLEDKKEAYINIAFTTLGSLLGGSLLYFLALSYFEGIENFLDIIPGISGAMVEQIGNQIQNLGVWDALLTGITSGIPYKIYASWSGYLELSFIVFFIASAFVRTLRFTAVVGLTHMISVVVSKKVDMRKMLLLHAACWLLFYIFYFYKFG